MKIVFMKYLIVGIIFSTFFYSCKFEKHEKEISGINLLRIQLSSTDSLLKNVDVALVERIVIDLQNNSKLIQFNINKIGDTLDFKTASFLNSYRLLLPFFMKVANDHNKIAVAIDSTKLNLTNLEHDILNNSLAQNLTPDACLLLEQEQVKAMYDCAVTLRSTLDEVSKTLDSLSPQIALYIKEQNQKVERKAIELEKK